MHRTTEELLKDAENVIEHLSESKVNPYILIAELSAKLREREEEERCYHHTLKKADNEFVQCTECFIVWDISESPTKTKKES